MTNESERSGVHGSHRSSSRWPRISIQLGVVIKRRIVTAGLAVALAVTCAGGSTYALFAKNRANVRAAEERQVQEYEYYHPRIDVPEGSYGPGLYLVGKDIKPGKYVGKCVHDRTGYWSRLRGVNKQYGDIIEEGLLNGGSSSVVEIKADDLAFRSEGGIVWTKLEG